MACARASTPGISAVAAKTSATRVSGHLTSSKARPRWPHLSRTRCRHFRYGVSVDTIKDGHNGLTACKGKAPCTSFLVSRQTRIADFSQSGSTFSSRLAGPQRPRLPRDHHDGPIGGRTQSSSVARAPPPDGAGQCKTRGACLRLPRLTQAAELESEPLLRAREREEWPTKQIGRGH
jgi:hypothetical protein